MIELNNKTFLITGATSGIGKEVAIQAARSGAKLLIIGRDKARLDSVMSLLTGEGHQGFLQDLTKYDELEDLINVAAQKSGKIDGFVHCAGIEQTIPLRNMSAKSYENLFAINVIAGFELARILSKTKFINDSGGSFVFLSSVMGKLGQKGKIGYCSSKSAIIGGVKAMALEMAQKKIRCNTILPGIVNTELTEKMFWSLPKESVQSIQEMHPLGIGRPVDVASLCLFLLSDLSTWITGSEIVIDGGYSVM